MVLEQIVRQMAQLGVADVILPFFLIFVLVFAILQKIELFGARATTKPIHVVLALVVGAAVVFMHVLQPRSPFNVVPMINTALPWVAAILVILLAVHLIIGLFTGSKGSPTGWLAKYMLPLVGLVVLYIFFAANGFLFTPPWFSNLLNGPWVGILLAIIIFGAIIYFITRGDSGGEETAPPEDEFEDLGDGTKKNKRTGEVVPA